jgi:hypothetical protein
LLNAHTVSDNQFVEIPGKQLFERSPREVSIREGQPDIERNTAIRRCNALQLPQRVAKRPSVITLKPAIRYHFKTGQRDRPKT